MTEELEQVLIRLENLQNFFASVKDYVHNEMEIVKEELRLAGVKPKALTGTGGLIDKDVMAKLRAGLKIEAIKIVRNRNGISLKDAKKVVDNFIEMNPTFRPI